MHGRGNNFDTTLIQSLLFFGFYQKVLPVALETTNIVVLSIILGGLSSLPDWPKDFTVGTV
jgi:hypothetical protein